MIKLIEDNKAKLHELCERYDVKTMHLFGSAAEGDFMGSSDIDLLITFKDISAEKYADNYFELHETLEKLFQRKVDLVTARSLSNPIFIERVEKTKQPLYAA